ncbi:ATP-dependent RNA helicase RhlB [Motiliproteus sp. MSK22-1]|uniref:ATP-dependent RNA helicase RhlB n=1 Tax=Motiliproteus sp. MSK22-1 TaxID=1897630 RepID=UPI00097B923F|nr:ATP-dependent RNA helicase RhlB [Motiliproteus sp. MSK22-1]OMH38792.1 ATP-dependent RNA helicase RhlB [Motiliproteus sp. MSK22-1]
MEKKSRQDNWSLSQFIVPEDPEKIRFHDLDLPDSVMHAIADVGFQYCTPIQAKTLVHTLEGKDLTGKAQTGTGKTAAFLISALTDMVDYPLKTQRSNGKPRALVVAPTRELVMQIAKDAAGLIKYTDLKVLTVVGGMDYEKQRRQLKEGVVDLLVATPGRLLDFNRKGDVDLSAVETLVLDEADRMLSMGFIPDVREIIRSTPHKKDRQTLLFSATFSEDILNLARMWTLDSVMVEIEPEHVTSENVKQQIYLVGEEDKFNLLYNVVRQQHLERVMVFANRRDVTRRLTERLKRTGIGAELLSGEVSQSQRVKTLEAFRSGRIKVLVATDVAGRGIHVDGVSHVINYNLPEDPEDYVHRIGRTGRAGAEGISYSFACETDSFMIPEIEELIGQQLECVHPSEDLLKRPS